MFVSVNKQLILCHKFRTSISVLPGKRLKDFFFFIIILNAYAGNEALELRVERACCKL